MIKFRFDNCMEDIIGAECGVTRQELDALRAPVEQAHARFQEWRASGDALFYDLPLQPDCFRGIPEHAARVRERFDTLVVLGIGGSALGLRCVAQALLHPMHNVLPREQRNAPRLFVCDNIDPDVFGALLDMLDLNTTCFNVISKSGRTTETAAQMYLVVDRLKRAVGESWREHLVITTDPEGGELRPLVQREQITAFDIPRKLGGRYSVFSAVGMFPAACLGIDIEALRRGAALATQVCATASLDANPAYRAAAIHHVLQKKGRNVSVMMPYADSLALFADWYAQLWAESLGKHGKGTCPVKALGVTDQHSQLQMYMDGPADKLITFVEVEKFRADPDTLRIQAPDRYFSYMRGRDLASILRAELDGTVGALCKAKRPNMTVSLPELNAWTLGQLLMVYQIMTAAMGALWDVNPFDQPGVESSKILTREILSAEN